MNAKFGTAGTGDSFSEMGYKSTPQVAEYLQKFALNAYEYQCGHGLRVNKDTVKKTGENCKNSGISLSLHTPYYISLSSVEEEKREKSVDYILDSAKIADILGADRIIIHSGSCSKISREEALLLAGETLKKAQLALDENELSHIHICPETMGKFNQLGTLDEVLELCGIDERFIPCIDFGHLNARTLGGITDEKAYEEILNAVENKLGLDRLKFFHSHFSKIEYTEKGGEKKHLTFDDTIYGPDFEPLAELIAKKNLSPTFICESAGTQAEDSMNMKKQYEKYLK